MNPTSTPQPLASVSDPGRLHGKNVLVRSSLDRRNPLTAVRGTIEVRETGRGAPVVQIALDLPQMFATRARHRTFTLDAAAVARLVASEREGAFEITLAERLDPESPPGGE